MLCKNRYIKKDIMFMDRTEDRWVSLDLLSTHMYTPYICKLYFDRLETIPDKHLYFFSYKQLHLYESQ